MDDINLNIGNVLREERKRLAISLDEAAKRTGVSKAMLGQIERNVSSPTVSTAWKIAVGLRIPISQLLSPAQNNTYKVNLLADNKPAIEQDGKLTVYNLFPFDPVSAMDYLYIVEEPGTYYPSTGHPNAVSEHVLVTAGQLTMHIAGKKYLLGVGDSIKFAGNEDHAYENAGDEVTVFQCITKY